MVDCAVVNETAEETVVVALLEEPVMVSETENVPEGTVIVIEVAVGLVITEAVAELVPPVIVSPMVKLPLAATDRDISPTGYSVIPEATV